MTTQKENTKDIVLYGIIELRINGMSIDEDADDVVTIHQAELQVLDLKKVSINTDSFSPISARVTLRNPDNIMMSTEEYICASVANYGEYINVKHEDAIHLHQRIQNIVFRYKHSYHRHICKYVYRFLNFLKLKIGIL